MITLKRLEARNFKGLSSIDLTFPERGSVLIEGYNEAGKSTLFEAVYVALYGKPLVGEDNRARMEEIIQHNQSQTSVQLAFKISQQELTITRIFERGKSQQAILTIQRPDIPQEMIKGARAVDERILKEMGNLDGDSLLNSCFVEQKELGRIEALLPAQREQAIQKLLGLERLTKLIDQFKFRREQERELTQAENYLKLAQLQADVRLASSQEAELAERLDAVRVANQIQQMTILETRRVKIEEHLGECQLRIHEARERLNRCNILRKQSTQCDQAHQQLAEVRRTRDTLRHTEQELTRLESIVQIDIPAARTHLSEVHTAAKAVSSTEQAKEHARLAAEAVREAQLRLKELKQAEAEQQHMEVEFLQAQMRVAQRQKEAQAEQQSIAQRLEVLNSKKAQLEIALSLIQQWEADYKNLHNLQQEMNVVEVKKQELDKLQLDLQQKESEVRDKETAVSNAEREMQITAKQARLATGFEVLTAWLRLKSVEMGLAGYVGQHSELTARHQEAETALAIAKLKTRRPFFTGVIFTVLTLLVIASGILWHPAFVLLVITISVALAAWLRFFQTQKLVQQKAENLNQCDKDFQRLEMQRQVAIQAGGDPITLVQYEQQLQLAGFAVPSSMDAGQELQEELRKELNPMQNYHTLQEATRQAQISHARLAEQLKQARSTVDERTAALQFAQQSGNPLEQLRRLRAQAVEQERRFVASEQKARESLTTEENWPTNSNSLQTALYGCQAELYTSFKIKEQQALTSVKMIKEAEADKAKAEHALLRAREYATALSAIDPNEKLSIAQKNLIEAESNYRQREAATLPLLSRIQLQSATEVEPERGRAEAQLQTLIKQLDSRPLRQKEFVTQRDAFIGALTSASNMIRDLLTTSNSLSITELPPLPLISNEANTSLPHEHTLTVTLQKIKDALEAKLIALDEQGTRNILEKELSEQGQLKQQKDSVESEMNKSQMAIGEILASRNIKHPATYTQNAIVQCWPLTALVFPVEESQILTNLDSIRKRLYAAQQQEKQLVTDLHHPGTPLSIEECRQRVVELIEDREVYEKATKLLRETHDRIARRVLPITERNMQPLLQQLTNGRYRDVRLTPEENNGQPGAMDYRIRVWDTTAKRYVSKNLFSGGTRDQCSLALRLAFALATLPQELGVAPGFIFLDEPLSAFDAQRAQALVELLTTGTIARQFNQVVLISHYHAFDREVFQYHIRMEAGQVIESDLPDTEKADVGLNHSQIIHTGSI